MKTIERAKVIIMQCNNLNEEDAYKHLRRKAMQRRVTIGMLASSIVDSKELLGQRFFGLTKGLHNVDDHGKNAVCKLADDCGNDAAKNNSRHCCP